MTNVLIPDCTENDQDAVKILRAAYMQTAGGSDILYDARQYLQDRERYAAMKASLPKPELQTYYRRETR